MPPANVLLRLGEIYGHTVEDFFKPDPPPPRLDDRPMVFFRAMPGVTPDPELMDKVARVISQVNAEFRDRKKGSRKRTS